jgi:hypothetical protein
MDAAGVPARKVPQTKGYDLLVVEAIRLEIKLSCVARDRRVFQWNHVRPHRPVDFYVFIGVLPDHVYCWTKKLDEFEHRTCTQTKHDAIDRQLQAFAAPPPEWLGNGDPVFSIGKLVEAAHASGIKGQRVLPFLTYQKGGQTHDKSRVPRILEGHP